MNRQKSGMAAGATTMPQNIQLGDVNRSGGMLNARDNEVRESAAEEHERPYQKGRQTGSFVLASAASDTAREREVPHEEDGDGHEFLPR